MTSINDISFHVDHVSFRENSYFYSFGCKEYGYKLAFMPKFSNLFDDLCLNFLSIEKIIGKIIYYHELEG